MMMPDAATSEGLADVHLRQQRQAALHTSGHAWRTAAVMTCLLSPCGFVFGIAGLLVLKGLGDAIERGEQRAEQKLKLARVIVLTGTALGFLTLVTSIWGIAQLVLTLPEQIEQIEQIEPIPGGEP